jgi:tRNA modification GTPase
VLDSAALLLYFPPPNTVTGEDILEIHTHGGPAIVKAVLKAIPSSLRVLNKHSNVHTIRYAEPGEFTKRAFYNNRLDLTQIEALGDSLSAETEQQRRLAVNGTSDELTVRYEKWRNILLYARGELEALIDFSEDQHFDESPGELISSVSEQVMSLRRAMTLHTQNASKGELLRNGISIALLGAPNAGKSSLLNRIVGREAAIVSSEEGTTRDIVDVSVDIGGWLCHLGDMAGLRRLSTPNSLASSRSAVGEIETEGIRRAKARAFTSDLVVIMLSLERSMTTGIVSLHAEEELMDAVRECQKLGKPMIAVINKMDRLHTSLTPEPEDRISSEARKLFPFIANEHVFLISCLNGSSQSSTDGDPGSIQRLLEGLKSFFATMTTPTGIDEAAFDQSYWEQSLSVSHRQCEYLRQCLQHLDDFLARSTSQYHSDDHADLVCEIDIVAAAENLRFAAGCLAKITGTGESGDVEDVLKVVFAK